MATTRNHVTTPAPVVEISPQQPPPILLFDDGSRSILTDQNATDNSIPITSSKCLDENKYHISITRDPYISIREFYEIDRLVNDIKILLSSQSSSVEVETRSHDGSEIELKVTSTTSHDTSQNNSDNIKHRQNNIKHADDSTKDDYSIRIAVQFPDELLIDAPEVCWEYETSMKQYSNHVLVFCLGDTTYAPCCPDVAAAMHLNATCIVHYGPACLTPYPTVIPVLYSFGVYFRSSSSRIESSTSNNVQSSSHHNQSADIVGWCVNDIIDQIQKEDGEKSVNRTRRILLLYEVMYHSMIDELQTKILEQGNITVVAGKIPDNTVTTTDYSVGLNAASPDCGAVDVSSSLSVCRMGGLELPTGLDFSEYTFLFIGNDQCRQYMNIVLQFLSSNTNRPQQFWTWRPPSSLLAAAMAVPSCRIDDQHHGPKIVSKESKNQSIPEHDQLTPNTSVSISSESLLMSELSDKFRRKLNRRFYLIQKAKHCSVFGILVANLSDTYVRSVVRSLRELVEYDGVPVAGSDDNNNNNDDNDNNEHRRRRNHSRTSYTFAVGKINCAKLSNYADIDCFVLVACPEHSILEDENEYPVPIITPFELCIAFGIVEWGSVDYSLNVHDYLSLIHQHNNKARSNKEHCQEDDNKHIGDNLDDDDDAPYFSLVTGKYESSTRLRSANVSTDLNLSQLPGQGKVTTYYSAAANFLSQRQYQGLELIHDNVNEDSEHSNTIKVAVQGQCGIASKYGDR
jgi:diphthamide synthase subunit DPH2